MSKLYTLAENMARAALSAFCNGSGDFEDMTSPKHRKSAVEAVYKILMEDINSVAPPKKSNIRTDKEIRLLSAPKAKEEYDLLPKFDTRSLQCKECGRLYHVHNPNDFSCPKIVKNTHDIM
jgi:hypothetical protein